MWPLEVLDALATAERRNRIDPDRPLRPAARIRDLQVTIDADITMQAWGTTAPLAACWHLTMYVSTQLERARHMNLALATRDTALRTPAASSAGVGVLQRQQARPVQEQRLP
ncbi:MAG: hypothetical protein ABI212_02030 [Burkholderiaceae bacterium]